jgi:hypothetical protein
MKRWMGISLVLLAAGNASAGWRYVVETSMAEGPGAGMVDHTVEVWAEGEKVRIEFEESGHPAMKEGTYLLSTDGGQTVWLVNPREETYSEWNIRGLMSLAGGMMNMMGVEFSDPDVKLLGEEPGGVMLGHDTVKRIVQTDYAMSLGLFGMKKETRITQTETIWTTDVVDDEAAGFWFQQSAGGTGNEEIDKLIRAGREKVDGFPLKRILVQKTSDAQGRGETTRTVTEVTMLKELDVDEALFEIPAGYEGVDLMPKGEEGGASEGGNPLKDLLKGFGQ